METKTKVPKVSNKKQRDRNIYNLPKGRLTEYWEKFSEPAIQIIDMRAVLR